jgi:hypothetical protein
MIKTSITISVIVGLLSFVSSASAVEKKQPGTGTPPRTTTAAPLTEGECTQLGGTVRNIAAGICISGQACSTTDEQGQKHTVCISASKK